MPVVNMTARFLESLKPGPRAEEWFDEDTRGLSLKVNPGGAATWYYHYSYHGRRRRVQLGKTRALGLKDARRRARKMAGLVADGKDPAGDRRADRDAFTVADIAELFLKEHAATKRSGKAQRQALARDVLPIIGNAKAEAVTRRDIGRIVDRIAARGVTIGASRTFEIMRSMWNWGIEKGLLDHNPCSRMKKPFPTRQRDRVLSHAEIRRVWAALCDDAMPISRDGRDVLKLCLITAQRLGECAGMTLDELDLERRIWIIPPSRSKNGFQHRVPLSDMAIHIIRDAVARASTQFRFLFPGYGKDDALKSNSVANAVWHARASIDVPHWTAHDLRRTAATYMGELGVPPHVIAHCLNHRTVTAATVTTQVYVKYTYDAEKRQAFELWSAHLAAIIAGAADNVIPLKSA